MQSTVPFNFIYRYWNQVHSKCDNLFNISLESEQKQVNAFHWSRGIYLTVYLSLIIKIKGRTIAVPAHYLNIFGVLFCLLIKKLMLENNTIWQSLRKFQYVVWGVATFSHIDKEGIFFSWNLRSDFFLDNYLYMRHENLKRSLKI